MTAGLLSGAQGRNSSSSNTKNRAAGRTRRPPGPDAAHDWQRYGLVSPHQKAKTFVLDTNVLLHDPGCVDRFDDNHICIPVDVLSELDRFKNEQNDRGASARAVHRKLSEVFQQGGTSVTTGVPTGGGGSIRLAAFSAEDHAEVSPALTEFMHLFPAMDKVDHRILACALMVREQNTSPVILVTKDLNLQLKARAIGIACEDYLNDKAEVRDVASSDLQRLAVDPMELQRFASSGVITLPPDEAAGLAVNEYVLLQVSEKQTMPARHAGKGRFVRLQVPESIKVPKGQPIRPLNLGQQCLLDALLDPDISLVTCYGQAGTGESNPDAGPGADFQGSSVIDVRYPYAPGKTGRGQVTATLNYAYACMADYVPPIKSTTLVAAAQTPVVPAGGSVAMTLASTNNISPASTGNRAVNVPVVPFGQTMAPANQVLCLALDPGHTVGTTTSGSAAVASVGDNRLITLGQWVCIPGGAGSTTMVSTASGVRYPFHGNRADAMVYLSGKIRAGGMGVWGQVPMPPQTLADDDAKRIARWLADGARK